MNMKICLPGTMKRLIVAGTDGKGGRGHEHHKLTSAKNSILMMETFWAFVLVVVLCCLFRLLHLGEVASFPLLYYNKKKRTFVESILQLCGIFKEVYQPPLLWGKSGHLQTIIYAKLGRIKSPYPKGRRKHIIMSDGATMTYDLFEPHCSHKSKGDYTFLMVPGIANSSEASYICTFVNYAQDNGYRIAVLNHLGALSSVKLTAPRIFTYGCTDEYHAMVEDVLEQYPNTKLLGVGFSMGANIVVKYVGESKEKEKKFLCVMSICQGYSASQAVPLLLDWQHMRRGYVYAMTANQKSLLRNHYKALFSEEAVKKYDLNVDKILQTTSLLDLDELYSRRRAGYKNVEEYYEEASCCNYLQKIELPVFFLNAEDDPLVPRPLVEIAKNYVENSEKSLLVVTKHGGHLGYFETGYVTPKTITWLDRAILQYAEGIVSLHLSGALTNKLPQ